MAGRKSPKNSSWLGGLSEDSTLRAALSYRSALGRTESNAEICPARPVSWLRRLFALRMRGAEAVIASPAAPVPPAKVAPVQSPRVVVKRLILPEGIEAQIIEALQRGDDPDEKWTRKGRRRVYGAFFHKVVGESFDNPNGVSRQSSWPPPKSEQRCTLSRSRPIRSTLRLSGSTSA
jgi:hypothetical protein